MTCNNVRWANAWNRLQSSWQTVWKWHLKPCIYTPISHGLTTTRCVCACVWVCGCVCVYIIIGKHGAECWGGDDWNGGGQQVSQLHMHAYTYTHTCMHSPTYTCMYMHAHTHPHVHTQCHCVESGSHWTGLHDWSACFAEGKCALTCSCTSTSSPASHTHRTLD